VLNHLSRIVPGVLKSVNRVVEARKTFCVEETIVINGSAVERRHSRYVDVATCSRKNWILHLIGSWQNMLASY
jgi:hypothetical protein